MLSYLCVSISSGMHHAYSFAVSNEEDTMFKPNSISPTTADTTGIDSGIAAKANEKISEVAEKAEVAALEAQEKIEVLANESEHRFQEAAKKRATSPRRSPPK